MLSNGLVIDDEKEVYRCKNRMRHFMIDGVDEKLGKIEVFYEVS